MFQSRTHTCNELRIEHVGQQVTLVGWMENVREVGGNLAFVILRDFYGTTQVVVETEDMMKLVKSINKESTIRVEGIVRERDSKNPKLSTGISKSCPAKSRFWAGAATMSSPFRSTAAARRMRPPDSSTATWTSGIPL